MHVEVLSKCRRRLIWSFGVQRAQCKCKWSIFHKVDFSNPICPIRPFIVEHFRPTLINLKRTKIHNCHSQLFIIIFSHSSMMKDCNIALTKYSLSITVFVKLLIYFQCTLNICYIMLTCEFQACFYTFLELFRTLWNFMAFYGTLWNFLERYRTLWHFMAHQGTLCNFLKHFGTF